MEKSADSLWSSSVSVPVPLLAALVALYVGTRWCCKSEDKSCKQESLKVVAASSAPSPPASEYRLDDEHLKIRSTELSRRGPAWSQLPAWHLPSAPRKNIERNKYLSARGLDPVKALLRKFDVDPLTGFMPSNGPLQRLPYVRYQIWEDICDDLPKLLGARAGQVREPLSRLPVISTDRLITDAELRRAHLLLSLMAHAYVWGGDSPLDTIPKGIAIPLCDVSKKLGLPPVLTHPDIVLYNWRKLDPEADLCMENMVTLNNFFDGRDESWFYLITADVEAKGAYSIVPMMLAIDAVQRYNEEAKDKVPSAAFSQPLTAVARNAVGEAKSESEEASRIYTDESLAGELSTHRVCAYVTEQLKEVAVGALAMCESISVMREGCLPFIFFHRVRPFLSGWKHNPTLPRGVIYEGVSDERFMYHGGSAAQSTLIPFLDITLGIEHENKSKEFLLAMRDYMVSPHRAFLQYIESVSCVRAFVLARVDELKCLEERGDSLSAEEKEMAKVLRALRDAYDLAVAYMQRFRGGHIAIVAEYIMAQQKNAIPAKGLEASAGGKGTGGTDLMTFLKPLREDCTNKLLIPASVTAVRKDDVEDDKGNYVVPTTNYGK